MRYGEQKINNAWYCFDTITGARVTGFYNLSGRIVYYGQMERCAMENRR